MKKNFGKNLEFSYEEVEWPSVSTSANYSRLVLHAVGYDTLFIVERANVAVAKAAADGKSAAVAKELTSGIQFRLAANASAKDVDPARLQVDTINKRLYSDNAAMNYSGLHVHHASPSAITYTKLGRTLDTDGGGFRIFDQPTNIIFAPVAVAWEANVVNGATAPLLSLIYPQPAKDGSSSSARWRRRQPGAPRRRATRTTS